MSPNSAKGDVLPSVQTHCEAVIAQIFQYIIAQGDADYIGENVSQLQHSLQCADMATKSGADNDTIAAALLHDIGRFIPASEKMEKMIWVDGSYTGIQGHEIVGETYLRHLGFSEKICQLVGAHVAAKRYLTAIDPAYHAALSETSKRTLKFQGGSFTNEQITEAQRDPWLTDKIALRRWDDLAKDPNVVVAPLETYRSLLVQQLLIASSQFQLHGRNYRLPTRPTVFVCIDGFDPPYLEHGIATGTTPTLASFRQHGFQTMSMSAMPSFTNTNNVSIITGMPSSIHGIVGNYLLDRDTGKECMIQDDRGLRGSTLLEQMQARGVRVAAITAKDKLRRIIGHGLSQGICLSVEKAAELSATNHGIDNFANWLGTSAPSQYSAELSLLVLDAGIKILEEDKADLLYLTLSDFVQHKHAPGSKEATDFMAAIDRRLGLLTGSGADVAVTGDHGMNDKSFSDGTPNVLFLEDELTSSFGDGSASVICPISDPYTRHHGGLGSFVRVYVRDTSLLSAMMEYTKGLALVDTVLDRKEASHRLESPYDLEGDFAVVSVRDAVIGSRKTAHDLTSVEGHRLRSHGGFSEQEVPILMSCARNKTASARGLYRNYDVFHLVLGEKN